MVHVLQRPGGIARDLAEKKEISEVYGLGEAGLFDEFFYFLEELGIMRLFTDLDPHRTKRASNVSFSTVILVYLMRIVAGLAFFWHIDPAILHSQPLMRLVSVKAHAPEGKGRFLRKAKALNLARFAVLSARIPFHHFLFLLPLYFCSKIKICAGVTVLVLFYTLRATDSF
jgi:hypothetical protein